MKLVTSAMAIAVLLGSSVVARSQEPELISEIVAKVNNDIITRNDYMGALHDFAEELRRQMLTNGKSEADFNAEFERLKPTVLDLMIEDLLLEQKAKELSIDVEADVNAQMIAIAKENGKNLQEFEDSIKKQGIDPESARASLRKRLQHQYVIQQEVIRPVYQNISDAERKEFFERNKEKFVVPGGVVLSEIFLPLEGHSAAEIEQRAKRLIAELRAGADFADAVAKNTAPNRPSRTKNGKLGFFNIGDLNPDVTAAISSIKDGEVTEPIRYQDGFQIVRLDERKAPIVHTLDEKQVADECAKAVTMERAEVQRKKYTTHLRSEAYVYVKPGYASAIEASAEKRESSQVKTKN